MNNTEKKLVTLKDYFDAGVIEKFSDFCIYDKRVLKDCVGNPINLALTIDKFYDCEVSLITSDPFGVPKRVAIFISTDEFCKKNNLSDDDIRKMVIECNNYCICSNHDPSFTISFDNDNNLVIDVISTLRDMGAMSSKTKLFITLNTPVKHYENFYSFLFSKLNYDDDKKEKILNDDKIINSVAKLVGILVVNKIYKISKYQYHINVDYDKNKEKINKTLISLSAYINKNYR